MERKKAYDFLNNALSAIQTNRATHQALIEALNVLFMTAPEQKENKQPLAAVAADTKEQPSKGVQ